MITFNDKPDQANIIRLDGIGQSYDAGHSWIIKGLNLIVEDKPGQGQFIIILGMSGCGKSTLLRYIAGLQKPTEGLVYVNEKLVDKETRISMVFQQYSSLPWLTVLENVALSLQFVPNPFWRTTSESSHCQESGSQSHHAADGRTFWRSGCKNQNANAGFVNQLVGKIPLYHPFCNPRHRRSGLSWRRYLYHEKCPI